MHLSKSRYCEGVQCKKILWLNEHMPDNETDKGSEAILETGIKVGELAKGLFGDYDDVVYDNDIGVRIEKTQNLLKDCPNVITEASFSHDDNFCSVDILKNDADGVEIYEVKSSRMELIQQILEDMEAYFEDWVEWPEEYAYFEDDEAEAKQAFYDERVILLNGLLKEFKEELEKAK